MPGELATFGAFGPMVDILAPNSCYLLWNLASGGTEFGTPRELNGLADLMLIDGSVSLLIGGFTDCKGRSGANAALRINRAAAVEDYFVHVLGVDRNRVSVETAVPAEHVDTNYTPEGRARNRGVVIQVVASRSSTPDRREEGPPTCDPMYDTTHEPSSANCAAYSSPIAEEYLTWGYRHNAICACENTPNDRQNNCVRKCLQVKLLAFLSSLHSGGAAQGTCIDPFGLLDFLCPEPYCSDLHTHHEECYRECCCDDTFIAYPAFWVMCEAPVPCAAVEASIDAFNACRRLPGGATSENLGKVPEVHGTIQQARRGQVETGEESVTYNPETGAITSRKKK